MSTGRHPRHDVDLDATEDESRPLEHLIIDEGPTSREVPRLAQGSRPLPDPYFDGGPDEPQLRDLTDRVTALEKGARRKSLLRTWIERAISAAAGSAVAIALWANTKAEERGDVRGTARAREDERRWLVDTVRELEKSDAERRGQVEMLLDRLRYYPVHGPATAPGAP